MTEKKSQLCRHAVRVPAHLSLVTQTRLTWGLPGGLQGTSKHSIKWLQRSLFWERGLTQNNVVSHPVDGFMRSVCGQQVQKNCWRAFKNVAGKVLTCNSYKEITVFLSHAFGKGSLDAMCGISLECCILLSVLVNTMGKAPSVWLIKIATTCLSVYLSDGRNHMYTHNNSGLNL